MCGYEVHALFFYQKSTIKHWNISYTQHAQWQHAPSNIDNQWQCYMIHVLGFTLLKVFSYIYTFTKAMKARVHTYVLTYCVLIYKSSFFIISNATLNCLTLPLLYPCYHCLMGNNKYRYYLWCEHYKNNIMYLYELPSANINIILSMWLFEQEYSLYLGRSHFWPLSMFFCIKR